MVAIVPNLKEKIQEYVQNGDERELKAGRLQMDFMLKEVKS